MLRRSALVAVATLTLVLGAAPAADARKWIPNNPQPACIKCW